MRFIFSILLSILFANFANGQAKAFKGGEKLRYMATYKIGFFNVDVATIDFTVDEVKYKQDSSYKLNALAKILPQYRYFFDFRDEYSVWLKKSNLKPLYFENDIKEGSYTLQGNYVYDWDSLKVKTYENRPVWESPKRNEHIINENTLDAISMFYNLRNIPDSLIVEGVDNKLDLVFANRIRHVIYRFIGRDKIRVRGLGRVNVLHFKCQLANDSGVSFEDGDEFDMWLSDDVNKIPLYLESPIKVGSVQVRLINHEGVMKPIEK